jgi:hypothetical protein
MAKHTPGPYVARPVPGMAQIFIAQDGYMPHTCVFNRTEQRVVTPEMEADARLFVASADLLQAVKDAADEIEDIIPTHIYDGDDPPDAPVRLFVKRLRDLIAKVEG